VQTDLQNASGARSRSILQGTGLFFASVKQATTRDLPDPKQSRGQHVLGVGPNTCLPYGMEVIHLLQLPTIPFYIYALIIADYTVHTPSIFSTRMFTRASLKIHAQ
jgi:hypothetical protein